MVRIAALIGVIVWLVVAGGGEAARAASTAVLNLRLGLHPDKTRIVLDLTEAVDFQIFALPDPYRVIVDLPELDWRAVKPSRAEGVVTSWRHAVYRPGQTRIVFDVSQPVRVREVFVLPPGEVPHARFVLDLEPVSHVAFLQEANMVHGARVRDPAIQALIARAPPPRQIAAAAPTMPEPDPAPANPAPAVPGPVAAAPKPAGFVPVPIPAPPPPAAAPDPPAAQGAGMPPLVVPPVPAGPPPTLAGIPLPPPLPRRPSAADRPMVVIDPGHGGADPGAISVTGEYEKTITLGIARELRKQLLATGRYRVTLTRDGDEFVRLRDRVARARAAGGELFISLHADSIDSRDVRGLSIYTLSDKASDREAEMLAARENRADALGGLDLAVENEEVASILIDLAQRDTMNQSRRFANDLVKVVGQHVKLLPRPHRSAGFAVLTAPDVPSVLIELGYLSSPKDAKLLAQPGHQARLAGAILRGIDSYFVTTSRLSRS